MQRMFAGIEQFQPSFHIRQPDAAIAFHGLSFPGVTDREMKTSIIHVHVDMDMIEGTMRGYMFESVFHERDEQEGSDVEIPHPFATMELYIVLLIMPQLLDGNVVPQILRFFLYRDPLGIAFIQLIPQQLGKFHQRFARLPVLFMDQEIDGVQGIEKRMRIDLHPEILQLLLGTCPQSALQPVQCPQLIDIEFNAGGGAHHKEQGDIDVVHLAAEGGVGPVGDPGGVGREDEVEEPDDEEAGNGYQHRKTQQESEVTAGIQKLRDQYVIGEVHGAREGHYFQQTGQ